MVTTDEADCAALAGLLPRTVTLSTVLPAVNRPLAEIEHHARSTSAVWDKATEGHGDDSALLTLFLRIATGGRHATLISEKTALALVKKIQKSGLDADLPRRFIAEHAPADLRADYLQLWNAFIAEAGPVLRSDQVHATADALALLRRECNVGG